MPTGRTTFVSRGRRLLAPLAVLVILLAGCNSVGPATSAHQTSAPPAAEERRARTLVLYDTTGPYASLGELYAIQVANLVSHFGTWDARPVTRYDKGQAKRYTLTVYVGSTYAEPLPPAFLDDAADPTLPLLWIGANLTLLTNRHPELAQRLGFTTPSDDPAPVKEVRYHGTSLTRDPASGPIRTVTVTDPTAATVLGEAVHADGSTTPWAVRSGHLVYVSEVPFLFLGPDDRYLAFTDLLFDQLAPQTRTRHRALVRLEDVGPQSDPQQLRAIADYLSARHVPFSVAVFVQYDDPAGKYSGGAPVHKLLSTTPDMVAALKYLVQHGGTLIMHGDTHGHAGTLNPYGVSGADFEFYRAHIDGANQVVLDGPVQEDSKAWALSRLTAARAEWAAAGIPAPGIFEFPHYAASATDYRAVSTDPAITARYERAMYFSGVLRGGTVDPARYASQLFPYPVRDVYGAAVIPENLGNVDAQKFNQHEARQPDDILASARRQLVVRDGVASFFYHPFLGLQSLPKLIEGIQALGYTFVPADTMILR